jgi:hypothetical protein
MYRNRIALRHTHPRVHSPTGRWDVTKLAADLIAAWRSAERIANAMPEGSPERQAAERASERVRDAYQDVMRSKAANEMIPSDAHSLVLDDVRDVERMWLVATASA